LLKVDNLNVWFGKSHVIRGISLEVAPGSILGLLGRNGVGKTTTLRAIMGLLREKKGSVTLDGTDLGSVSADRVSRAGVGYVPQGRQLFPHLSVYENLKLAWHGRKFDDADLERGLTYFPRLKQLLGRYAGTLSGGEQQMAAVTRALLNSPRALLMDEPSEGLSPLYVDGVRSVTERLKDDGLAVLLVEQNLGLAMKLCDHVTFVEKGVAMERCSLEEAQERSAFERYLGVSVSPSN
jgi:branched-chain amino acid transport system ATP-binding protein